MKPKEIVVSTVGMNPIVFSFIAECYPFGYRGFIAKRRDQLGKLRPALPVLVGDNQYYILLDTTEVVNYLNTCIVNNIENELFDDYSRDLAINDTLFNLIPMN